MPTVSKPNAADLQQEERDIPKASKKEMHSNKSKKKKGYQLFLGCHLEGYLAESHMLGVASDPRNDPPQD